MSALDISVLPLLLVHLVVCYWEVASHSWGSYDTYAGLSGLFLGCSCSDNGGLDSSFEVSLENEQRTGRKVQTSG